MGSGKIYSITSNGLSSCELPLSQEKLNTLKKLVKRNIVLPPIISNGSLYIFTRKIL